jgi:integrase
MPYVDTPAYFQELRQVETVAAKALAFTILTATRPTETRECRWSEIDIKGKSWTIPPERMKGDREHRIPLTDEALKILEEIKGYDETILFPGIIKDSKTKQYKSISEATVRKLLRKTHDGLTVHGFRSSFRDWCAEMTAYPREVAEAALAHSLSNATEAAYQRGDLFAKRFKLMDAWSTYCTTEKVESEVIPINKTAL